MTDVWTWLHGVPTSTSTQALGALLASLYMKGMLTMSNYHGNATYTCTCDAHACMCTCVCICIQMYVCICIEKLHIP